MFVYVCFVVEYMFCVCRDVIVVVCPVCVGVCVGVGVNVRVSMRVIL